MEGRIISERYRLKKYLGGGMSSVYLADDIILDREVVVKLIKADPYNKQKTVERFQREVQNTTKLSHPNIVTVLDVDESSEYHVLVTEYINGPNLKQYIGENNPLSYDKIVELSIMILRGIEQAHERGIVHRDIKPQNIIINHNGEVKITDFGIAKALSETRLTETNQVMGSVQYIAPEQAKGRHADERADIYSFGIMLFEMITGELPFQAETQVSVALQHIQNPLPNMNQLREDIPMGLKNIVLKCTEKDPNYRYSNANEVITDLLDYTHAQKEYVTQTNKEKPKAKEMAGVVPIQSKNQQSKQKEEKQKPPPPPPSVNEEKKKRKKWPFILLGLLLLLLILALVFLLVPKAPKTVQLEDVSGLTLENAKAKLETQELVVGSINESYDDDVEKDVVISTNPKSGNTLDKGTKVDINVSKGKEPYKMEDFVGQNIGDVEHSLKELGFNDIDIERQYSDDEVDTVIDQSIAPNEKVSPKEETITLTVSDGVEPIEIKNYIGTSLDIAKSELESNGFVVNVQNEIYSDEYDEGIVIGQDPSYGSFMPGSPINLTTSKGPAPKKTKEFEYNVTIPYGDEDKDKDEATEDSEDSEDEKKDDDDKDKDENKKEENKPKKVNVYIEDKERDFNKVVDSFAITEDTPYTIDLALEEGETGKYKVTVAGETVIDESVKNDN